MTWPHLQIVPKTKVVKKVSENERISSIWVFLQRANQASCSKTLNQSKENTSCKVGNTSFDSNGATVQYEAGHWIATEKVINPSTCIRVNGDRESTRMNEHLCNQMGSSNSEDSTLWVFSIFSVCRIKPHQLPTDQNYTCRKSMEPGNHKDNSGDSYYAAEYFGNKTVQTEKYNAECIRKLLNREHVITNICDAEVTAMHQNLGSYSHCDIEEFQQNLSWSQLSRNEIRVDKELHEYQMHLSQSHNFPHEMTVGKLKMMNYCSINLRWMVILGTSFQRASQIMMSIKSWTNLTISKNEAN